jgi:hypothetical protein
MSAMLLSELDACSVLRVRIGFAVFGVALRLSDDWPFSLLWFSGFMPFWLAAAWAAACWARSFLEALPRFLRSRMYSQPSWNSASR